MKVDYHDIAVRALKTFLQGFLAVVTVGIVGVTDLSLLGDLMFASTIGGLAAIFSWLQNFIKETM